MASPPIKHVGRLLTEIQNNGIGAVSVNSNAIVSPANLQAGAQPIIDAFDDSAAAQAAADNVEARTTAVDRVDNDRSGISKTDRATLIVAVDEINMLRQWLTSFKVEVAAAASLADLKTRVATLPNVPDRTTQQAYTAIKNKITSGAVD